MDVLRHGGDDAVEVDDVASKGCPGDDERRQRQLPQNLEYPVGTMQIVVTLLDDDGWLVGHRLTSHSEVVVLLHLEALKATYLMILVRKLETW